MKADPLTRRRAVVVAGLAAALVAGTVSCGASGADSGRQAQVAEKGQTVMPFDLERTTHRFAKTSDGGVQTVFADDPGDKKQIQLIRGHLTEEFNAFRRGDFSDPSSIHGTEMPGLKTLSQGYAQIQMRYENTPVGARITFTAKGERLVGALHDWFDAQVSDHGKHAEHGNS